MVTFFENIPSSYRSVILISGLLLLWMVEGIVPRFHFSGNRYRHAGTNLFFTIITIIVNTGFAFLILKASRWTSIHQFGLLNNIQLPIVFHAIVGLLMLDFISAWLIHWIMHKTNWMWQFHKIHHIDTQIDVTTALRHHPVESLLRVLALFVAIISMGVPFWMVMFYQTISAAMSQFNHANIRLPKWMDTILSWVIVTPDMHKVHHSRFPSEASANYANIFSIWDRLFGTFVKINDTSAIKYGLDEYQEFRYQEIGALLKVPWEHMVTIDTNISGQRNKL